VDCVNCVNTQGTLAEKQVTLKKFKVGAISFAPSPPRDDPEDTQSDRKSEYGRKRVATT